MDAGRQNVQWGKPKREIKTATSEQKQAAIDLHNKGLRITDIAKQVGFASTSVRLWLYKAGVRQPTARR